MVSFKSAEPSVDFSAFVKKYGDKAYNFAYRLAGNEQDARDLVQEAFSHALKHIEKYDTSRPFEPWFNRILKNIYLDGVRRYEQKHTVSLDGPSPMEDVSWEHIIPGWDMTPAEELDEKETHEIVQKALNSLPIQYRMAVALCDIENYSYEEISGVLGCPIGTVRSRIHQGRLLMRKAFEKLQYGEKRVSV
jgi:RNA polymerase sigma-70 factor, ECF subfamily